MEEYPYGKSFRHTFKLSLFSIYGVLYKLSFIYCARGPQDQPQDHWVPQGSVNHHTHR